MKIAKLAEAYNLPVMSHGAHDVHIQLLAACPNTAYMEVHAFGIEDYITNPLKIENGYGIAPDLPGIGFEFDLDRSEQNKARETTENKVVREWISWPFTLCHQFSPTVL